MSTQRLFNISTVADDLTREEAITQIAYTLDYLAQTSEEIFGRIEASIKSARDKLKTHDSRISLVNLKVNSIKGHSNKATKIYSSAKYPIRDPADENNTMSISLDKWSQLYVSSEIGNMKHKLHKYTVPYSTFDELSFKEKFSEFSVPGVIDTNKNSNKALSSEENTSLGSVLSDQIESTTSLLLFNTAQHPYKQTLIKDPLGDLDLKRKYDPAAVGDNTDIYEAPQSILKGNILFLNFLYCCDCEVT